MARLAAASLLRKHRGDEAAKVLQRLAVEAEPAAAAVALEGLLDDDPRRVTDRVPAYALYTDPPLARIGMARAEAKASGKRVLVGHLPMARVGRARERGETDGHLEALIDADTQRILGATLVGIEADEAIHGLLDVMSAGLPYTAISRTMHIHPTVSELIPTMLQSLAPLE